jgi:hypothetical protein
MTMKLFAVRERLPDGSVRFKTRESMRAPEPGSIAWLFVLVLLTPSPSLADSGRIFPRPAQTFRGWGMSLAWEANDLYGGGRLPAQIKAPDIQSRYMDLLYGDPATRVTLGFNIARYNIAGGDDPTHKHMRADAQMEGFQNGPGAAFDWTRDAPQRRMLQEAKKRGAGIFEAASYSPPYWMTVSGCSSGADAGHHANLREGSLELSAKGHIIDELPVRSVTTYIIDGVSPLSIPPSGSIEGLHQIVSEGTKLCLNINQNSTRSGEAIIPYPCSGFSNMEFNVVDQGNGSYSIHTVNGAKGLCLNVSNATASPGDGKKYGGPGNLIQWNCSDGRLPDNELFEVVDLGGDRVQLRVKSSGLCLEDPGRGGTIRQNRCSRSIQNQAFILTE